MEVNLENFDKLDGFSPKSFFTFLTRKIYVRTVDYGMEKKHAILNPNDMIEFTTSRTNRTFTYLWNGFSFKRVIK